MTYQTKVYKKQGGAEQVVASGGTITVQSGGTVALESGATLSVASGATLSRSKVIVVSAGEGRVGATAGFAIPSAHSGFTNAAIAGCPAGQTGATLVIPLSGYKSGDTITAMRLCGQLESAGNTATVQASLVKVTNEAAGDVVLSTLGSITQITATADQVISSSVGDLTEVVTINTTYFVLVTVTTAASTDVQITHVRLHVTEA